MNRKKLKTIAYEFGLVGDTRVMETGAQGLDIAAPGALVKGARVLEIDLPLGSRAVYPGKVSSNPQELELLVRGGEFEVMEVLGTTIRLRMLVSDSELAAAKAKRRKDAKKRKENENK